MGGIILDQPLPVGDLQSVDPFLLIHHWNEVLPGGQKQREVGVGPHPHRGFSPVSVIYKGAIHHRDSFGHDSVVTAGGTQWMVSGKGVTHSERPSQQLADEGGPFEFIQFWVNLPAEHKLMQPEYIALQADETPKYEQEGVVASVIAGEFKQIKGGIDTVHDVSVISIEMKKDSELDFDIPLNENGVIYQLDGAISVQNKNTTYAKTLYEIGDGESERVTIKAHDDTRILMLCGKPLNEKVAQYGPFVMNNQTEIMQAIRDSQMGKMGVLIE
jgi:redox-sensitive bicupin YhaK (pirin superfamily)